MIIFAASESRNIPIEVTEREFPIRTPLNAGSPVETRLGKDRGVMLQAGGEWHLCGAGGGGWGVPWERDPRLLTSLARRLCAIGCPRVGSTPLCSLHARKKMLYINDLGDRFGFGVSVGEQTLFECGHFRTLPGNESSAPASCDTGRGGARAGADA